MTDFDPFSFPEVGDPWGSAVPALTAPPVSTRWIGDADPGKGILLVGVPIRGVRLWLAADKDATRDDTAIAIVDWTPHAVNVHSDAEGTIDRVVKVLRPPYDPRPGDTVTSVAFYADTPLPLAARAGSPLKSAADILADIAAKGTPAGIDAATPAAELDAWLQDDARGLGVAIPEAMKRAAAGEWSSGGAATWNASLAVADLRALIVAGFYAANAISMRPPLDIAPAVLFDLGPPGGYSGPGSPGLLMGSRKAADYADPSLASLGVALQAGWALIAQRLAAVPSDDKPPIPYSGPIQIRCLGGNVPVAMKVPAGAIGAAGWPLAVAVIAGISAAAYLGGEAIAVRERLLAREEDTRRLVALLAASSEIAANHADADAKAGKASPLSPAEAAIVDSLRTMVGDYGAATKARESKPDKPGPLAEAGAALSGAAALAVVALVGYLLIRSR